MKRTMPTKPQVRANRLRVLDALRSGEYEQTDGTLKARRRDETVGYCCLGVMCDVSGIAPIDYVKNSDLTIVIGEH